jgi:hypothetical protein
MTVQVLEYINVKERYLELECNIPTRLAFLPINFDTAKSKAAMQAHSVAKHLDGYVNHLHLLEHVLFSPQLFFT